MSPQKGPSQKELSSSNHQFSGQLLLLVSGRVKFHFFFKERKLWIWGKNDSLIKVFEYAPNHWRWEMRSWRLPTVLFALPCFFYRTIPSLNLTWNLNVCLHWSIEKKFRIKNSKVSTVNSLAFLVQVLVQMITIVSVLIPGDVEDKIRMQ